MGEDPDAPNYDPDKKLIRSMINGSRGPMLRKATALDWVGDPFDATGFVALHGESTYRAVPRALPGIHRRRRRPLPQPGRDDAADERLSADRRGEVPPLDRRLHGRVAGDGCRQNGGIIPSFVDLDGRIGGPDGRWWNNAYGWGFSPVNPVTGRREDRNRIPRALVGFSNALLVTGDQKYVDAWRDDDRRGQLPRARDRRPQGVSDDARRRRLVRLAAASRGASARSKSGTGRCATTIARASAPIRGSRSSTGKDAGYPEAALRARSREHPAASWRAMRARQDAAGEAARRQHARLQPGGDRRAGAA